MYKQRDKYFTTNSGNPVSRILSQKDHFTPYEFEVCLLLRDFRIKS